jgi:hypothetical protein
MPRRPEVEELKKAEVPGAMEAMTDEGAAEARQGHAEAVERAAVAATGAPPAPRFPAEAPSPAIPDERRPGLGPVRLPAVNAGVGDDVKPIEDDDATLRLVQDPYGDRDPKAVAMIPVKDSYGNVVTMPV